MLTPPHLLSTPHILERGLALRCVCRLIGPRDGSCVRVEPPNTGYRSSIGGKRWAPEVLAVWVHWSGHGDLYFWIGDWFRAFIQVEWSKPRHHFTLALAGRLMACLHFWRRWCNAIGDSFCSFRNRAMKGGVGCSLKTSIEPLSCAPRLPHRDLSHGTPVRSWNVSLSLIGRVGWWLSSLISTRNWVLGYDWGWAPVNIGWSHSRNT